MKKLQTSMLITVSIGITFIVVAAILRSIWGIHSSNPANTSFNANTLGTAFDTIGYLVTAISGVVLTALFVVSAVKNESSKTVVASAIIALSVGLAMIVLSGVLGAIPSLSGTTPSATNQFVAGNLSAALNTLGYLTALFSGIILAAQTVSGSFKEGKK